MPNDQSIRFSIRIGHWEFVHWSIFTVGTYFAVLLNHWLRSALKLEQEGKKCTASTLLQVLLTVAAHTASIFAVCRDLAVAPTDQTIRNALEASHSEVRELERRLNRSLATQQPKVLFRTAEHRQVTETLISAGVRLCPPLTTSTTWYAQLGMSPRQ